MCHAAKYASLKSSLFRQNNVQQQKVTTLERGNDIKSCDKNGYIFSIWEEINKLLTRPDDARLKGWGIC